MNIIQFLRIFWARRRLIFATTASALVGAYLLTLILPAAWEGNARVMLNSIKPDPVTGEVLGGAAMHEYISTQIEMISDYSVAGKVVDQIGWLSDPDLIKAYEKRSKNDVRDYRQWLAQNLIDKTKATLLADSNILEITYTGATPAQSKAVVELLRKAYIDTSVNLRRDDANKNADWYETQAAAAKAKLDEAESARAEYERANGIVMADENTDVDSARLRSLAAGGVSAPMLAPTLANTAQANAQLAEIDAKIQEESKLLGPNHPELLALKATRAAVARQVAEERSNAQAQSRAVAAAANASAGALDRAVQAQKSRVVAMSDKLGRLSQLQNEVNIRKDQFIKTSARAAQFREEGAVGDSGLTPLGLAYVPKAPKFPNMLLIIPGSMGFGFVLGILISVLMELINRRVRGPEDLAGLADVPLLAVIGENPVAPWKAVKGGLKSLPFFGLKPANGKA